MKINFKKVAIIGPGLIGGAVGLALKKNKLAHSIVGVARYKSTLKKAIAKGAIDIAADDLLTAVKDADLVVLATPVNVIKKMILLIKDNLEKGCIVFDVGSTKKEIVELADKSFPKGVEFIGVHPMAGSEKTGVEYASADFFLNSVCFLTKGKKISRKSLSKIKNLWKFFGANVVVVTASAHDKIVASVSHLPHFVSVALADAVEEKLLKFTSTGFKDTTRIAAGDEELWSDICFTNKKPILEAIEVFQKKLNKIREIIASDTKRPLKNKLLKIKLKMNKINK